MDDSFPHLLLLLGLAVTVVLIFQRLKIPSSLGYLLVGVILGGSTLGPSLDPHPIQAFAEFGIVFLLFTIGLNFSLPQIYALRHLVLGLGTAQVLLTTAIIGILAWLLGLPPAGAFVVGAVFAQSSTTIISKQLAEQGDEYSRHGRLGTAMSVFQDVTAVPFVVVFPVLGMATAHFGDLAGALGWAFIKATLAFSLVYLVGRWLFRPLFHLVAERRSPEIFTLTVLLVSLLAGWTTNSLGLSMAFGAFLAGMMLGETEFRHQVESTIRPFRDVLLGLFFVGIGLLFDLSSLPDIWHWALFGAIALLLIKTLIVAQIVHMAGIDAHTSWRTGWILAVGGEFGFALVSIAMSMNVIASTTGQIALTSVLFSMIIAPFLIRYNQPLASLFASPVQSQANTSAPTPAPANIGEIKDHVIICGYGRIGQGVARFLDLEAIPYLALDLDSIKVKQAHLAGERVFYGDATERDILEALGVATARLVVISHEDVGASLRILQHLHHLRPELPVMVRTRDESRLEELRAAGATEVVAETLEASLMIAANTLMALNLPISRVVRRMKEQREGRYRLLRELYRGDSYLAANPQEQGADRLRPVSLPPDTPTIGKTLDDIALSGVVVTALVREGKKELEPPPETRLESGDVLVLFGSPEDLEQAEQILLGRKLLSG